MRKTTTLCILLSFASSIAWAQEEVPPPLVAPPPQQYLPPPQYLQPPPPVPTHLELRPNYALIFSGVGVFGLGYILDVSGTLLVGHQPAWECAIPLVGPYLQVNDTFSKDWSDLAKGWYVFDGLIQTAGFVLTVVGVSLWHKVPVRSAQNGLVVTF
jgi:hypothetical protein